jgi:NAD(P)-dependent dehydrogenase (short-subunit alcohol dehydrogenase family)
MNDLASVPNVTLLQLDVTKIDSIRAARDKVRELLASEATESSSNPSFGGGLDLLINNAGIALTKPALDHPIDDIRTMFETNVFGMMSMVQEFVPLLMKGQDPCIVNVGSVAGVVTYAFGSSYNASKAAVHAYSDTLRLGELNCLLSFAQLRLTTIICRAQTIRASHTFITWLLISNGYQYQSRHRYHGRHTKQYLLISWPTTLG